jgi:hypothetical protein
VRDRPVAFLFLGETLLIPHLYPIVEALAADGDVAIDLWVATSVHEQLLTRWSEGLAKVRIRHAPGFRALPAGADGRNPPLPAKIPTLVRLVPHLLRAGVVVCAEQTSLWLPRALPFLPPFVKTSHGVGSMSARDDPRRRAARVMLVPSERERTTYLARGFAPDRVIATGYVKSAFGQRSMATLPFADARPVVLYAPHWQRHRSSWWHWGAETVQRIAGDGRWNLIFAPHQRLVEGAPEVRQVMAALADHPNVHCDIDGFAMVDGSYTAAADLYLGDTSSQVIEFLSRPRPCVFLNAGGVDWRADPSYAQWACGEVVDDPADLLAALVRAPAVHAGFVEEQARFAADSLGDTGGAAPACAARIIRDLLDNPARSGNAAA